MKLPLKLLVYSVLIVILFKLFWLMNEHYEIKHNHELTMNKQYEEFRKCDVFFIETSCASQHVTRRTATNLIARQACAVESAAFMHPTWTVCLLDSCISENTGVVESHTSRVLTYANVRVLPLNIEAFLADSPLWSLYSSGLLDKSSWPVVHASDMLRLILLWKFGGIYLDLDTITVKSLEKLGTDFAGLEDDGKGVVRVGNSVLGFQSSGFGHEILEAYISEMKLSFRTDEFAHNGPTLLTRVLGEKCKASNIEELMAGDCPGFSLHLPHVFYPIPCDEWRLYFEEGTARTLDLVDKSHVAHLCNHLSHGTRVRVGSNVLYDVLARRQCPRVYSHCGAEF